MESTVSMNPPEAVKGAPRFTSIGVDIGQLRDHSAVVISESQEKYTGEVTNRTRLTKGGFPVEVEERETATFYEIRDAIRLPLNTPWPKVGKTIANAVQGILRMKEDAFVYVTVDVTGIGRPVVDLALAPALQWVPGHMVRSATFTHGDRKVGNLNQAEVTVGKYYLVSRIKTLFQSNQLALPAGHQELELMIEELMDFDREIDEDANERYGAFKVGTHDDLVTALGLAVLEDPLAYKPFVADISWG